MNKSKAQDIRILVIDDEPMMSDSLRRHLEEEGYAVDTAATGAQAIDLFDGAAHHLVICDLQLPDMDGLTLLRHMKDARPTTEVIVVTGYGSVQTAVEATKAGAFYFVEKPFDFEELSPLIEKALERRELMAETANMLPEAEVVFLDELFNANSAILNNLLTVLNERVYRRGAETHQLPLLSLFSASNHSR